METGIFLTYGDEGEIKKRHKKLVQSGDGPNPVNLQSRIKVYTFNEVYTSIEVSPLPVYKFKCNFTHL